MDESAERRAVPPDGRGGVTMGAAKDFLRRRMSYFADIARLYAVIPRRFRFRFWRVMTLQFGRAALESLSVLAISAFVQSVSFPDALRGHPAFAAFIPYLPEWFAAGIAGDGFLVVAMCLAVVALITVKNIVSYFARRQNASFSERLSAFFCSRAYDRYFAEEYLWHLAGKGRVLSARMTGRGQLATLATSIIQIFGNLACVGAMFAFLLLADWRLTLAVIGVFGLVSALAYAALRRRVDRAGTEVARLGAEVSWAIRAADRGIREIILHGRQEAFRDGIAKPVAEMLPHKTFLAYSGYLPGWFLEAAGFAVILGVMAYLVNSGAPMPVVVGKMSLLLLTAWRVLPMLSRSMALAVTVRSVRPRALACLETVEALDVAVGPGRAPAEPGFRIERGVELRGVAFRYPGARVDALMDINLSVARGERLGIVGTSGSGKSTLAMILAGLVPPAVGAVLADGQCISAKNVLSYRQQVGFVPQHPLLLPGTIAQNIALSRWGEGVDRERIEQVRVLAAMDFVEDKKGGLGFRISETGDGLSGGEAQRLAIARALYGEPDLVVFDEATSSLDYVAESAVMDAMASLDGVAAIIIAHRLSTVRHCHRVVWLEKGRIRDVGSPEVVLPRYAAGGGTGKMF